MSLLAMELTGTKENPANQNVPQNLNSQEQLAKALVDLQQGMESRASKNYHCRLWIQ